MKCYILEENKGFNRTTTPKESISAELENEINVLCSKWQVRDLRQSSGGSLYGGDDNFTSHTFYEPLDPESFVISNGKIIGYFATHFDVDAHGYVLFTGKEKVRLGSYDNSDYRNGTGKIDRGHVDIVPRPDLDTNPYYDEPGFHSQEEYDDYIKWRD